MKKPADKLNWVFIGLGSCLCLFALPLLAQTASNTKDAVPEFKVPVLEGVDPTSVRFDDRILERDRSQAPMGEVIPNSPPTQNRNNSSDTGGSASGSYGGATVFQGGPQINVPTLPSGTSGDGGSDVNVSVNGVPIPSVFDGSDTASSSGSGESIPGSNSSDDSDGGIDVNVSVTGGPQMPGLPGIPGMPGESGGGMPGMPGSSSGGGMPGMPGSSSGGGMPGMPGSSSGGGMPTAGLPGSSSGSGSSSGNSNGSSNGNGRSDGSSNGGGNGSGTGNGSMGTVAGNGGSAGGSSASGTGAGAGGSGGAGSRAGQRSVLDARLDESFGVFDGMIIGERERAQADANAAGSSVMGTGGAGAAGGEGEDGYGDGKDSGVLVASVPNNSTGGGMLPAGSKSREGEFNNQNQATFAAPEDIPNGNDDDVVARQLREAATHEPDPVLREKLWDEYRKYTGLSQ